MTRFKIDLHNHSCLSPCGSLELSPSALAVAAQSRGIEMLALTDHNTARNLPAFAHCCEAVHIVPVFGLEVTTVEEIHVVCLFETLETALHFGTYIEFLLPDIPNVPEIFGDQVYVDSDELILGCVEKNLLSSAEISFELLIEEVLSRDGLAIPAHIDRPAFSVSSQLGFLPDLPYSAVESVRLPCPIETWGNTVIRSSDAHYPEDVGKRTTLIEADHLDFASLKRALADHLVSYP